MTRKQYESAEWRCVDGGGRYSTRRYLYELRADGLYRACIEDVGWNTMLHDDAWKKVPYPV